MKYLPQLATVHTAAVNYSQLHLMLFLGSTSMDLKIDLQSLNFLSQKCSKYIGINVTFENIQKSFLGLLGKQKALHLPVFSIFFFSSSIFPEYWEIQSKKNILHTIAHLIQYMVLETQFWSIKCTIVTVRYTKMGT